MSNSEVKFNKAVKVDMGAVGIKLCKFSPHSLVFIASCQEDNNFNLSKSIFKVSRFFNQINLFSERNAKKEK